VSYRIESTRRGLWNRAHSIIQGEHWKHSQRSRNRWRLHHGHCKQARGTQAHGECLDVTAYYVEALRVCGCAKRRLWEDKCE
jgi:hypothetical protein